MKENIIIGLREILFENISVNEPMFKHTSFKAGGNAAVFAVPGNDEELTECIRFLESNNENYFILGNGTNLLVSDEGYDGVVIQLLNNYSDITIHDNCICTKAGALLSRVAMEAMKAELTGLEFASGIPGSVGGAVTMNAGAYGSEMSKVISTVKLFDTKKQMIVEMSNEQMDFAYRHSIVKDYPLIVLETVIELQKGNKEAIRLRMEELKNARNEKQPIEYPSAGSTFKRPEGYFAGKLIEDAGLKGFAVGGAMVSKKHAGFIINENHATADDIYKLIIEVQNRVFENSGVKLEPEVCFLGF